MTDWCREADHDPIDHVSSLTSSVSVVSSVVSVSSYYRNDEMESLYPAVSDLQADTDLAAGHYTTCETSWDTVRLWSTLVTLSHCWHHGACSAALVTTVIFGGILGSLLNTCRPRTWDEHSKSSVGTLWQFHSLEINVRSWNPYWHHWYHNHCL